MSGELLNKVVLVTGGTEGIGKSAVRSLAAMGADLVLVGRNRAKTDALMAELRASAPAGTISGIYADLSRLEGMRSVATAFRASYDRLDVLVNNAGAVFTDYQETEDGIEQTFALNHLSYFLIATELQDLLVRTPGSRVISTASGAHRGGSYGPAGVRNLVKRPSKKAGFSAYSDSKLANILFTRELSRRLAPAGVAVNSFHPGWVSTGFGLNNQGFLANALSVVAPLFARTPARGAETLVWLASSPEAAGFRGGYFHDKRAIETTKFAQDAATAAALWALSEAICNPSRAAAVA